MPKFLFEGKYTAEGAKAVVRDGGTARRAALDKAITSAGGRMEAFYFGFGGTDVYVLADLPDNTTAAALAFTVAQAGMASTKTVVLLTPEEADAATKKVISYRPPGG